MMAERKPHTVHLQRGALANIAAILERLSARAVFLVADQAAYVASGVENQLEPLLARENVERFGGFELNRKVEDTEREIELMLKELL